jgi:excisionase family DNA binding protein
MGRKRGTLAKYFAAEDKRREEAAKEETPKTRQDNVDILVTVDEAAEMCRMSRAMFYKLHAAGKTPRCVKLGRLTRWRRQELLDWIKAGCPSRGKWEAMSGRQRR